MEVSIIVLAWLSVAVLIIGIVNKIITFSSMPQNLRWEVYPVPHETKERCCYGGSYMEEMDWANKPLHPSRLSGELIEMASEIFLLKRVREHNKYGLWPLSMAMHWGTYFLFGWLFLLFVGVFLEVSALSQLVSILGPAAFILGALGCSALILKRATNAELKLYTTPVDFFNLLLLLSIFVTGIISWLADPSFVSSKKFVESVVLFSPASVPSIVLLNFGLFGLFLIYMPFSKYMHYLAKFYTFHKCLWQDSFKDKGSAMDKKNIEQVGYKFKWAGPHANPNKTWLENAQELMLEEVKKEGK